MAQVPFEHMARHPLEYMYASAIAPLLVGLDPRGNATHITQVFGPRVQDFIAAILSGIDKSMQMDDESSDDMNDARSEFSSDNDSKPYARSAGGLSLDRTPQVGQSPVTT